MRSLTSIGTNDLSIRSERINDLVGAPWTSGSDFKKAFKPVAMKRQLGYCAYCSIEIGEDVRNDPDIEHFADKSIYPHWAFELQNLFLTCKYCNQKRKGRFDTVIVESPAYESCYFALVHPYLDDVGDHMEGGFLSLSEEPSIPTPRTLKGLRTIRLFKLEAAAMLKIWLRIYSDILAKQEMDSAENDRYERAKEELSGYSN